MELSRKEIVTLVMALEEFRELGDRPLAERFNALLRSAAGDTFVVREGSDAPH